MTITTTPQSTARLQFHAGFTMDDGAKVIPYLAELGISHLYASPLLKARPGSTHCYDIVDHNEINPELGGEPALRRMVATLRTHNMGLILDIVPNHMGVGGADNAWWLDVLEWGRASPYAEFFDIDWTPPDPTLHSKLLAPFLGAPYGDVLAAGDLQLQSDEGALYIAYHEHRFPIAPRSAAPVLHQEPALNDISHQFATAARTANRQAAHNAATQAKTNLAQTLKTPEGATAFQAIQSRYNSPTPDAQRRLHELLERQSYRLAWWRAATDEINWRRFFDINALAGLRVELPRVFDATHEKILALYAEGLIDGVRIDHIDGLADPRAYARKLRRSMETAGEKRPPSAPSGAPYIVIEKILAPREKLPTGWLTNGTTGYDFMDQAGGLFHDPAGEAPLTWLWTSLTGRPGDFEAEEHAARRQILTDNLASELNATAATLHRIATRNLSTRDYTLTAIRRALTEILIHFPSYRIYASRTGPSDTDTQIISRALAGARRTFRAADSNLLAIIRSWIAGDPLRNLPAGHTRHERLRAMVRFQQLSAPTAAKSVEDTAFYRFGRLLSRNEVGSNPGIFATTPAAFHAACLERHRQLPGAMLATATHDHKRGEDTRMRLAVLSEIPEEWEAAISRWMRLNAIVRRDNAPAVADELMLYQMLVAAWPLGLTAGDGPGIETFEKRVAGWFEKSIREAKLYSEWAAPNEAYESACAEFLHAVLDPGRPVLAEIVAFANRIAPAGALNSLAQTALHLTTPGVPDLYQGSEFWDQSFVDPDNRRPVDFLARAAALHAARTPATLLPTWRDGAIKQAVIAKLLALRRAEPELFAAGDYRKLEADGPAAGNILAFTRRYRKRVLAVAIPRLIARQIESSPAAPSDFWRETCLKLPTAGLQDIFTGIVSPRLTVPAGTLFQSFPIVVLMGALP